MCLIEKLVLGEKITPEDIDNELLEICERVHASCDDECPVYGALNEEESKVGGCPCHRNSQKMKEYIIKYPSN